MFARIKWFCAPEQRALLLAFSFFFLMDALDILSTLIAMQLPGVVEANPLMRDQFLKFLVWNGVWVKFCHFLIVLLPLSWVLQKSLRTPFISGLPFLVSGYYLSLVVLHNAMVIWRNF